jgi:predicted ATPase
MVIKTGRFVITGAPCAGKTTIINELAKQGYHTVPEPSRGFLEKNPELRASVASKEEVVTLQKMILNLQLESEKTVSDDEPVFMDGGIPTDIAYYKIRGIIPPKELIEACRNTKYDKVFIADMLPFYEKDKLRQQSEEESIKIHNLIYEAYSSFGYEPIRVPLMSPEERAEFIKEFCS